MIISFRTTVQDIGVIVQGEYEEADHTTGTPAYFSVGTITLPDDPWERNIEFLLEECVITRICEEGLKNAAN